MRARSPSALARRTSRDSARAEGLLLGCLLCERPVEVESVGDVELGLEPHGPGEVDVVVVEGRVAGVDGEVAVLRISGRVGSGEVVALDGLRDEPVELGGTDPSGDGGDLRVHEPRSLESQRRRGVDGRLGDRPRPPRRDMTRLDLRPQPGEAVAQLEGVADELLRRGRGDPEHRTELGDAELRHQRASVAGEGFLVVRPWDGERGGGVDGLGRVEVGPPGGEVELAGRFGVLEVA